MEPNGSGIGPICLCAAARSWTSGMRWSMPGHLRVCATEKFCASRRLGSPDRRRSPLRQGGRRDGKKRLRSRTAELRDSLQALIRYYSENAGRMRYDESVQRMTQATLEERSVVRTQLTPAVSEYTTRLSRANRLTALAISARST